MKKIVLILITLFSLTSCMTNRTFQREAKLSIFDLSKYSDKGFFISTYPYYGDYKPISLFTYEIKPKTVIERGITIYEENIPYSVLLDSVYNAGVRSGANGAVDVKFSTTKDSYRNIYKVEGLFIKK